MKRLVVCCTVSGILGGLVAIQLMENGQTWPTLQPARAQDFLVGDRGPGLADVARTAPTAPDSSQYTPEELTNIRVYETANRGVVNIDTRTVTVDRFFMLPVPGQGSGSGSVLDKQGHILTNYHVVDGARQIQVTLPGGKDAYSAELVGHDAEHDIAVLRIDAPSEELFPIPLGSSDDLRVGQRVYTLGNPFGLQGTLTTGIISSLNRTLPSRVADREMKSIIQTDAAMNPGNSGGPLLDTSGRIIGINVAIAARAGQSAGLGFAIPVNRVKQIVPELIAHGKVVRADIGIVSVAEIDQGLQIVRLHRGGPAERAGLRGWKKVRREIRRGPLVGTVERDDRSAADIIVAVDGQPVASASAFVEMIESRRPGDRVVLTVVREGQRVRVPVTLGSA